LSIEELDLIEFLVAQVASLSYSLTCEVVHTESSAPPPVACEVADLQSDLIVPYGIPPMVVDAPSAVVRSSIPPSVVKVHLGTLMGFGGLITNN
jgi:hypothetical protein